MVSERRREQPDPITPLLKNAIRLLEHRNARPLDDAGIDGDLASLEQDLQPIVEAADHDGADRAHRLDVLALALSPPQALFDRFGDRDALRAVSYTHLTLPTNREV